MGDAKNTLDRILDSFDGKRLDEARAFVQNEAPSPRVLDRLFASLPGPNEARQEGAAWMLWEYVSRRGWCPDDRLGEIVEALPMAKGWTGRLALLQCLSRGRVPSDLASACFRSVKPAVYDEAVFVRGWAIGALIHLAGQHPRYRRHVAPIVVDAQESGSAAVRARIRHAIKDAGWSPE